MADQRYVDWDGLVYYDKKIKAFIDSRSNELVKMGGPVEFKELPPPSFQNVNYLYKITDEFTSTDGWFVEENNSYKAGTWVLCSCTDEFRYLYTIFNDADCEASDYLENAIEEVKASQEVIEDNINQVNYELDLVKSSIGDLSKDMTDLTDTVEGHTAELSKLDDAINEVEGTASANTDLLNDIEDRVDALDSNVGTISTKVKNLSDEQNKSSAVTEKVKYELIDVPAGIEVNYSDKEIQVYVGDEFDFNSQTTDSCKIQLRAYAPSNAMSFRQGEGVHVGSEKYLFDGSAVGGTDTYDRQYAAIEFDFAKFENNVWVKSCSSEPVTFYAVEWYDINDNIISSDVITIVFTNSQNKNSMVPQATLLTIDAKYATKEYVNEKVLEAVTNGTVDTSAFVTDTELEDYAATKVHKHTTADIEGLDQLIEDASKEVDLTGYATESWVEEQGYLKTHQDISDLETKADAQAKLNDAKAYTDTRINSILGSTELDAAFDTIKEIQDYITTDGESTAKLLEDVAANTEQIGQVEAQVNDKADKDHAHKYTEIVGAEDYFVSHGELDAIDRVTHEELDTAVNSRAAKDHTHDISTIEGYVQTDLTGYAKTTEVEQLITQVEEKIPSIEGLAQQSDLDELTATVNGLPTTQDVTDAINEFVNGQYEDDKSAINNEIDLKAPLEHTHAVADITDLDLSVYATQDDLKNVSVDLSDYYNKVDTNAQITTAVEGVESKIPTTVSQLTDSADYAKVSDIPVLPTKVSELENDAGYLTAHQSLEDYAKKTDLPVVPTNIGAFTNDTGYVTLEDVTDAGFIKEAPSDDSKVDKSTYEEDKSTFALKTDIPNVDNFVTEATVRNIVAEAELNDKDVDLTGYATKDDLASLESKIPSTDGLASTEYVNTELDKKADVTALDSKLDTATYNVDKEAFALKSEVSSAGYLTQDALTDYAKTSDIPNTDEFITMSDVEEKGYLTSIPDEYITEGELEALAFIDATELEATLTNKAYETEADAAIKLTEAKAYTDTKATETLTTVENTYATKSALEEAINGIDSCNFNLDTVVFTDGEVAANYDDADISGKSLRQLLELILGPKIIVTGVTLDKTTLSLNQGETAQLTATVAPDNATNKQVIWSVEGDAVTVVNGLVTAVNGGNATVKVVTVDQSKEATCEVTVTTVEVSVVDQIKQQELVIAGLVDGEIVETTWSNAQWLSTDDAVSADATETCFYQITDAATGEVIESGYQILSADSGRDDYQFAIPVDATIKEVQIYDPGQALWCIYDPVVAQTDTIEINGVTYAVYTCGAESSEDHLRIIIE